MNNHLLMKQSMHVPVITLDGPSGVGKGTLSIKLAQYFGWHYLDSGALYRLTALAVAGHGIESRNESAIAVIAQHLDIEFQQVDAGIRIFLEGDDVTTAIRAEAISHSASKIAAIARVRDALLKRQRAFRQLPGLVADGRDMGTVVFPDATLKIFLTASAQERAHRRVKQFKLQGMNLDYQQVLASIQDRDERDQNRSASPLVPDDDAVVIDTTEQSIEAVFQQILTLYQSQTLMTP